MYKVRLARLFRSVKLSKLEKVLCFNMFLLFRD
jgi:hypothetical protein